MKTTSTKSHPESWIKLFQTGREEEVEIIFYKIISKTLTAILVLLLLIFTSFNLFAQTPGFAFKELDINNVRAGILNGGDMFWNLINPKFEVPKNSGKHTIFTGALWIGGLDPSNNLHIAAQTYRQTGNDFWPGPIDLNGNPSVSSQWDSIWKVNKSVVDYHILHWNDVGYVVPAELATWPSNGTAPFSPILAPFIDLNANFIYEPALGEFPFIYGDQATYDIFNDAANVHSETNGIPLGIEVHQMSYEINSAVDSFLTNSVFMRYEVGNRSDTSYHDVYLGIWTDFDLGNYNDDYVGTDVGRNIYYAYNGDANDEGASGYGLNPPAQGVLFLSHSLAHTQYYNNNFSVTGNPQDADDFYNYLKNIWKDGVPITYGGTGYNVGSTDYCNYMFPGTTDPNHPTNWDEISSGNIPGDRRMLGSIGPLTLPDDSFFVIDIAFVYARGDSGQWSSVEALQVAADSIINRYAGGSLTSVYSIQPVKPVENLLIYPNPSMDFVSILFNNPANEKFTMRVFDITGKEVLRKENIRNNKLYFSVELLPAGIFSIQLQSDKNIYSCKMIKR